MFMSPTNSYVGILTSNVIWSRGRAPRNGISALMEETPESSPLLKSRAGAVRL